MVINIHSSIHSMVYRVWLEHMNWSFFKISKLIKQSCNLSEKLKMFNHNSQNSWLYLIFKLRGKAIDQKWPKIVFSNETLGFLMKVSASCSLKDHFRKLNLKVWSYECSNDPLDANEEQAMFFYEQSVLCQPAESCQLTCLWIFSLLTTTLLLNLAIL